jgi:hypothetical protein
MIKRPNKTHLICQYINAHPGSTRQEILLGVHVMSGSKGAFSPTSNHCYFIGSGLGNGGRVSVVHRGYLMVTGKKGRRLTYAITKKGMTKVIEYLGWVNSAK